MGFPWLLVLVAVLAVGCNYRLSALAREVALQDPRLLSDLRVCRCRHHLTVFVKKNIYNHALMHT